MNKKGDLSTILIIIGILLVLAFGSIIFSIVFDDITEQLKGMPEISENNKSLNAINIAQTNAPKLLDFFVFFSFVAFFIGMIIASIYIDVNPAVLIIFIIFLVIAVVIAGQITNVFDSFSSHSKISTAVENDFPLTDLILGKYFPLLILVMGVVVIVIMYGKSRRQGIGGEV